MAKLTGNKILTEIRNRRIVLDPFVPENVGPNSVDLTLGDRLLVYQPRTEVSDHGQLLGQSSNKQPPGQVTLDMKQDNPTRELWIGPEGFWLEPNILYLGVTNERAGSDYYASTISGRSSIGRLGLFVHVTAGFGDIGFKGHWTLELVATHRIRVYAGVRIAQIAFETVDGSIGSDGRYHGGHDGKYTGKQSLPTASKLFRDF